MRETPACGRIFQEFVILILKLGEDDRFVSSHEFKKFNIQSFLGSHHQLSTAGRLRKRHGPKWEGNHVMLVVEARGFEGGCRGQVVHQGLTQFATNKLGFISFGPRGVDMIDVSTTAESKQ